MERILIMIAADSWEDLSAAIRSAAENASGTNHLSWGVCLMEEPSAEETEEAAAIGGIRLRTGCASPWECAEELWQGESYILMAHPAMRFAKRWDLRLRLALRQCHGVGWGSSVLTGFPPSPIDPVDAVSPVAAEGFDTAGGLCYHKGTPLRYARQPMRSAFLNPGFCFAPSAFARGICRSLKKAGEQGGAPEPFFLTAFRAGWHLFTLHRPLVRMEWDLPQLPDAVPTEDAELLRRFREAYSVDLGNRQLSGMARTGIFTADLQFPMHVPAPVRWQEALRHRTAVGRALSPLCVTMKVTGYGRKHMQNDESYVRFSRLTAIEDLPMLVFADGENGRRILPGMPNVLEYKDRYGLPVEGVMPEEERNAFYGCSKMFLLKKAREKFLSHTHYVWIAFDYLRYPVYAKAALDWEVVLTDRIVLALVNGMPDTSMVCVPQGMLSELCGLITRICGECRRTTGLLPAESTLWQMVMHDKPEWFDPIELPARYGLLDIVMMSRSEEIFSKGG